MDIPILDNECWQCAGFGDVKDEARTDKNKPRRIPCGRCKGAGYLLTGTGEELVNFIERHFGIRRLG